MLPVQARLRRSEDFRAASRRGRSSGQSHLVVHFLARHGGTVDDQAAAVDGDQSPQVGFVVSKAVGNAVVRNRVRRQLRHICADRLRLLPPSSVLVIRAKPLAAGCSSVILGRELDDALNRLVSGSSSRAFS